MEAAAVAVAEPDAIDDIMEGFTPDPPFVPSDNGNGRVHEPVVPEEPLPEENEEYKAAEADRRRRIEGARPKAEGGPQEAAGDDEGPPAGESEPLADPSPLAARWELLADWIVRHLLVRGNAYVLYYKKGGVWTSATIKQPVTREMLKAHLLGERIIGTYPVSMPKDDGRCFSKWGTIDIDLHEGKGDAADNLACAPGPSKCWPATA